MTISYNLDNETIDDLIDELIHLVGNPRHADLVRELIITALKLVEDQAGRGDLKILSTSTKEMRHAFRVFARYRGRPKVSVFGSARTKPGSEEWEQAEAFARRIVAEGYVVTTGAGPGIMEAVQKAAGPENSFGLNIRLPFENSANPYIEGNEKCINFKYFFTRKLFFVKETAAAVCFPGGVGTQDESFEAITLLQTGKTHMFPVILIDAPGKRYWQDWLGFVEKQLLGRRLIGEEDLHLFRITDSVDEACEEITGFYRNYHSMRLVKDDLVFRIKEKLSPGSLAALEKEFADIIQGQGGVRQTEHLPEEANEPELAHLSRLVFRFDRRHFGRLRQMIDKVNGR